MRSTTQIRLALMALCLLTVSAARAGWRGTTAQDASITRTHAPGQVLVRFSPQAAAVIERTSAHKEVDLQKAGLSPSLNGLVGKYRIKRAVPVFRQYARSKQRIEALRKKEKAALTTAERHLLQRLNRAPKDANPADLSRIYKLEFDKAVPVEKILADLRSNPEVEFAQPNNIYECDQSPVTPNDPLFADQWGLFSIRADLAWGIQQGEDSVVVAVVDTGVQWNHPDLAANIWLNQAELNGSPGVDDDSNGFVDDIRGWDFVTVTDVYPGEDPGPPDNNPMDCYGHGTAVSGVVSAVTNNGMGVAGTTWFCKIMALRAGYKRPDGGGYLLESDIAEAMHYAADNGADVINMSFGGPDDPVMHLATGYAESAGCVLVASAGNSDTDAPHSPAAYQDIDVIAVSATDDIIDDCGGIYPDKKACFSSFGKWVDVSAPGLGIKTTDMTYGYSYWSGTSFSAPFTSAVAALVLSQFPDQNSTQVRLRVVATTDEIDSVNPTFEGLLGSGRINAYRALTEAGRPEVRVDGYAIVGDDSGYPDPGETVQMVVRLKNIWEDVRDVSAVLSTADAGITVINGNAQFGDIPSDSTAQNAVPFSFTVSEAVARGSAVEFTLALTGNGGDYSVVRRFQVKISYLWPVITRKSVESAPVLADLDLDGATDVIVASQDYKVYAINQRGDSIEGWPVQLDWEISDSPAVGDVTGDGEPEVVIDTSYISATGNLYVLDRTGRILPGWPAKVDYCRSPVLADLDKDGDLEIIVADSYLHVYQHDRTELAGWPVAPAAYARWSGPPAVGDIDNDGNLEIVLAAGQKLYIWKSDGTRFSSTYPIRITTALNCEIYSASLADIDGDGDLEIFMASNDGFLYAIHHTGEALTGWPVSAGGEKLFSSAVIGDLNGDGSLEIAGATNNKTVHVWRANGTPLPGWPKSCGVFGSTVTPALYDQDGDGTLEVFMGQYAWRHDGSTLPGWPRTDLTAASSPAVGRFDSLGVLGEILGTMYPAGAVRFLEAGPIPPRAPGNVWNVFRHDCRHTGNYGFAVSEAPVLGPMSDKTVAEDELLEFTISATDPNNDPLVLSASDLPAGASLETIATRRGYIEKRFLWTPGYGKGRTEPYTVTFAVEDSKGNRDSKAVAITVNNTVVFGTVYHESGEQAEPLPGAEVSLLSMDQAQVIASGVTDSMGKFKLYANSVADGEYLIRAAADGYVDYMGIAVLRDYSVLPFTVTLESGGTQSPAMDDGSTDVRVVPAPALP